MSQVDGPARSRYPAVLLLLALAVAGGGLAGVLVAAEELTLAGLATAAAGIALMLGGVWAWESGAPRLLFADSVAERALDAVLFGSIAWAALPEEPRAGAAALAALVLAYLASYLRARGAALGFRVEEAITDRAVRLGVVALGLVVELVEGGAWAAAAWSLGTATRRGLEVARRR